MTQLAVAIDLGTSGFRAQCINISSGEILSTAITTNHPLPGSNIIDHLHFALEYGIETAHNIFIDAVNRLITELCVDTKNIVRLVVCGNPTQLSLFHGTEIKDLAFAGSRKFESMQIEIPDRDAIIIPAESITNLNLLNCDVIIPPSICHHVGADALAMIIQTSMLDKEETSISIDFGTNAEIALFHKGKIITASAAAGPALEGQEISCGVLAIPGAIADVEYSKPYFKLTLLDNDLMPVEGSLVDMSGKSQPVNSNFPKPIGITSTGTIAAMYKAIETGLISLPRICTADKRLHFGNNISFTEEDLAEAGKAIGAIRAGYLTLCKAAGISVEDIHTIYMSGAAGTYVDAKKALQVGMIPPSVKKTYQVGNTSLAMACRLAKNPNDLEFMSSLASKLRDTHYIFASSDIFKKIFILELSYWTEGMPLSMYRNFLKKYSFPALPNADGNPEIIRTVKRDIDDLGLFGLKTIPNIGRIVKRNFDQCTICNVCIDVCPTNALSILSESGSISIILNEALCRGVSCKKCEYACSIKIMTLDSFFKIHFDDKTSEEEI
ncbi:MAG: methylamine methyltransferase corrinoid protein reductive activase [Bacteroidetes bacterium]|nr:methylamine methyltransferase corrinoid protein reductive activase [Bacteroidota bacterium]MBU1114666.1 methylamine methyltransferase corrinoid protein reductive activase [Bacteroidota bacterium]MBU1798980.1 methylamine methyltransferase corrinoid protein reductive activase [Bacteroidota bacterium]